MDPKSLFEAYQSVYNEELLYANEDYSAIDEFTDEELVAIVEDVLSEEGITIEESLEFLEEARVTYGHDTPNPDAKKRAERVDRIKSAASKAGSMAKDAAKKAYKTAREKGPGLLARAKKAVKGAVKTGRGLLAKGLRKGAELASKAASKVEPKETPKAAPKAEAPKEKAKSSSGTYRNVGAGKKEKAGGEVKAEPKSASKPNQERIKKAREKLKKAAKGSPSRGVRFATSGGKVASKVMRSGRDASDERQKAAKKFAKKAGISDSFEYLLGEIFEDMIVEGYVDDYETASCVLESLTDDDFDYVCEAYSIVLNEATETPAERKQLNMGEGFDTFDVVLEYLYVEGYAESMEDAESIMVYLEPEAVEAIAESGWHRRNPDKIGTSADPDMRMSRTSSVSRNSAASKSPERTPAERRSDRRTLYKYYGEGGKKDAIERAKKERDAARERRRNR